MHEKHYKIVVKPESTQLLVLVAAGYPMQNRCPGVQSFSDQTFVKLLNDLVASAIFPCNQLMKRSASDFIKCDEGCSLHTHSQTQNIVGADV